MKTKIKTTLALFAAFCGLQLFADAPTPVAVWDGDFDVGKKTGTDGLTYTLDLQDNTVTDGKLVISSSTVGAKITPSANKDKCSVLIKYSNLSAVSGKKPTLATIHSNSGFDIGLAPHTAGGLDMNGFYNNETTRYGYGSAAGSTSNTDTLTSLTAGSGYFLFTHNKAAGTIGYAGATIATMASGGAKSSTLKWSNNPLCAISIGGPLESRSNYPAWTNVKIEAVAIFNDQELTAAQVASFQFPSDATTPKRWGNIGDGVNGGTADGTGGGNYYFANSFNVCFATTDSICTKDIGDRGKARIKSLRIAARDTATDRAPTSITLTQGNLSVTSTSVTQGAAKSGSVYKTDKSVLYERAAHIATFDSDVAFDTYKNITVATTVSGQSTFGCTVIKPANSVMKDSSNYAPALEFTGDWYAPHTVSVNFGAANDTRTVSAGTDPGAVFADATWYNTSATSGGIPGLFGGTASLIYSAGSNYQNDNQTKTFNKGYFDDGSKITLTFSNLDNGKYDVAIYCASDSAAGFSYKKVNGVDYSWDAATGKAVANSQAHWGDNSTSTAEPGGHGLLIRGLSVTDGTIAIESVRKDEGGNYYRGCVSAVQIAKVYEATITGNANWSDLTWSPSAPPAGANVCLINNSSADTTSVTFDTPVNVGMISVVSPADKVVRFSHISNLTASAYDFSDALGGIGIGVTGGWAVPETLRNYIRSNNVKVIFDSTNSGATLDYSSANIGTISGHYVFSGGTHVFKMKNDQATQGFGTGATADNPTFYVKDGATVNAYLRDPCGWNAAANVNGILRIGTDSYLNIKNLSANTIYFSQRFYFENGSTLSIDSDYFRLNGGYNDQTKAQLYMPADGGTATLAATSSGGLRIWNDSNPGAAADIGANSTLIVSAPFVSKDADSKFNKYGAGTLKFTGAVSAYNSTLTVNGGTLLFASTSALNASAVVSVASGAIVEFDTTDVSFSNVISGDGVVVKSGSGKTTLTGANTYSGGTTVSAGTLVVPTLNGGSCTVNGGMLDIRTIRSADITSIADGAKLSVKQAASGETQTITISGTSLADGDYASKVQVCEKDDDTTLLPIKTAVVSGGTLTITLESTIFEVNVTEAKTISQIEEMALGEGKTFEQSAQLTIRASNNPEITVDKSLHITKFAIEGQATLKFNSGCTITAPTISATDAVVLDCSGIAAGEVNVLVGTISDTTKFSATGVSESQSVEITETGVKAYIKDTLTRNNPVTGEAGAQTYTHAFLGSEDGDWTKPANWRSKNADNVLKAYSGTYYPQKAGGGSGDWSPALFDGNLIASEASKTVSLTTLEGWDLCLAVLNGVDVTVATLYKFQSNTTGKMFLWVGEDSSITFGSWGTGSSGGDIAFAVAAEDGITFNMSFNKGNPISYYLKGEGTVNYAAGVSAGTHKIKQLEVQVGVEKTSKKVLKQKLITLGGTSTENLFSADANITATCDNPSVPNPTYSATRPTTDNDVGTYSIEQEADGVYAYVVAYFEAPTGDIRATVDQAVSWSNIIWYDDQEQLIGKVTDFSQIDSATLTITGTGTVTVDNATTLASVTSKLTVTGGGTLAYDGATVTSFPAAPGGLSAAGWTGTVELKGYTFNGNQDLTNYGNAGSKVRMVTCQGYMPQASKDFAWTLVLENGAGDYGLNVNNGWSSSYMKFAAIEGSGTLKMTKPSSGAPNIQYIFKEASNFSGNITIETSGNQMSTVLGSDFTPDYSNYHGKILVTGTATLASGKTWSAVGGVVVDGTLNSNGTLSSAVSGSGTLVYSGALPSDTVKTALQADAWTGTLWLKSYNWNTFDFGTLGNLGSKVKLTGVTGYAVNASKTCNTELVLEDDGDTKALTINNGWSGGEYAYTIAKLSGTGTWQGIGNIAQNYVVTDGTGFSGNINLSNGTIVIFGTTYIQTVYQAGGFVYVESGKTVAVASGKTWTAAGGFVVSGTLNNNGTLTGSLTLNGGMFRACDTVEMQNAIVISSASTISAAATKTLTISGAVSGTAALTIGTAEDTGTVVMPTYAGPVTVKTGVTYKIQLTQQQMIDGYTASNVTFEDPGVTSVTFVKVDGTEVAGTGAGGNEFKPELPTGLLKYGFAFNNNTTKEADASATLSFNGTQTYEDGVSDKALKLTSGQNYGTGFGFGGGDFTIVAIIKAPTDDNRCIFGLGGQAGTAGMLGMARTTGNNIKLFTKNGTELMTVEVPDAKTQYHSYAIRYDNTAHQVALSVDGGAFSTPVSYTCNASDAQFQFGGVHNGCPSGLDNAANGDVDEFRLYTAKLSLEVLKPIIAPFLTELKATIADSATGTLNMSELGWTPPIYTEAAAGGKNWTITDNAADVTAVFDTAFSAAKFTVTSGSGKVLTLKNGATAPTISAWDLSGAADGVAFDATTASLTPDDTLKTYLRKNEAKAIFKGTGDYGVTLDYGNNFTTAAEGNFKSHLVFDGGTHVFKYGMGASPIAFSTTGSVDNPTLYVKNGTTLNYYMKDQNGWGDTRVDTAVVRAATGSTLNILQNGGTMYCNGRFVLEPGATMTYNSGTCDGFRICGGADVTKAQFYVPAPTTAATVATLSKAGGTNHLRFDGSASAIMVENGATLEISGPIQGGQGVTKGGAGTLKFLGAVSAYTGTLTTSAGTTEIACGGTVSNPLVVNADATLALGGESDTTVSGAISGAGVVTKTGTGNLTISGTYGATGTLRIPTGQTIAVGSAFAGDTFTVGTLDNLGTLDLSATGVSKLALTDVTNLGTIVWPAGVTGEIVLSGGTSRDFTTVTAKFSTYEGALSYAVTETPVEYGKGNLSATGMKVGATLKVTRPDGSTYSETVPEGGTVTVDKPVVVGMQATLYDITFTNRSDIGKTTEGGAFSYKRPTDGTLKYDTAATFANMPEVGEPTKDTGVYIKHHPYIDGAKTVFHDLTDFTTVVIGTMSASTNTIFVHFGADHYNDCHGVLFATTEKEDEVVALYNKGTTLTKIATLSIPNSASARHVYAITKVDDGDNSIITVYVDANKRGAVTVQKFQLGSSDYAGVQVGSDFGGEIWKASTNPYRKVPDEATELGVLNVLRVYDYVLSGDQLAKLASDYPYSSHGGNFSRTFDADGNLYAEGTWSKEGTETKYAIPEPTVYEEKSYNPMVTIAAGSSGRTITVNTNLTVDVLTLSGAAMTFQRTEGHRINVAGSVSVGVPVTIVGDSLSLSTCPVYLGNDGHLTIDWSSYDVSSVVEETPIAVVKMDRDDSKITFTQPTARTHTYNFAYSDSLGKYVLTVTPNHTAGEIFYISGNFASDGDLAYKLADGTPATLLPGDTVVISNTMTSLDSATIASTSPVTRYKFAKDFTLSASSEEAVLGGATVTTLAETTLTFKAADEIAMNIAATTLNGGTVKLDGVTVAGNIGGTSAVVVEAEKSVTANANISAPVSGAGTITIANTLPSLNLQANIWTGTVVIPEIEGKGINLNNWGKTGSTIQIGGITDGWLAQGSGATSVVSPALTMNGVFFITAMSPWDYTLAKVSGSGPISFSTSNEQPKSITLSDVTDYTGVVTNKTTAPLYVGGTVSASAKFMVDGRGSFDFTAATLTAGATYTFDIAKIQEGDRPFNFSSAQSLAYKQVTVIGTSETLMYDTSTGTVVAKPTGELTGLHIVNMMPKPTSRVEDRDPNGRESGWIRLYNYGPDAVNLKDYKIVRTNLGKEYKTNVSNLVDRAVAANEFAIVYTSEDYPTAEDYGENGKRVATYAKNGEGKVVEDPNGIIIVPTKVNPKKYPMVRLVKGKDIIDEIIVPCDIDDNMQIEVVPNATKLERKVVYTDGTKAEYGPGVNSLYGIDGVKNDLKLLNKAKFAKVDTDYTVVLPVNPFRTGTNDVLEANTITNVVLEYRVFDPDTMTTNTVENLEMSLADTAKLAETYGTNCCLYTGTIPAAAMQAGKLVQFRAKIFDKGGKTWTAPSFLNPDVGYEWYGVVAQPETTKDPLETSKVCTDRLQTFLMFGERVVVGTDNMGGMMDKDIDDKTMTLPYGPRVAIYDIENKTYYDNVRIDLRGQTSKTFYKKSHGLRFNKVAPLVAKDPFTGDKYETRKTSFIAEYGDPMYLRQTLALRLMRESGIKAPFDWPVRLYLNGTFYQLAFHSSRFSDEAVEDFYGLNKYGYSYKNVHQMITGGEGAEKKTPDDDNEADMTVYNEFINRIYDKTTPKTADQLTTDAMKHFNIPAWVNYLAAVKVTQEADDVWTNLGLYINKYDSFFNANGDDTMMPLAYDMNLSWGQWYFMDDTGRGHIGIVATNDLMKSHPFYGGANVLYHYDGGSTQAKYNRGMEAILQSAQFREMLSRRLRTLAEKYLGAQDATKDKTPVWDWVVSYTNAIAGDVQIDRTMWKYDEKVISTTTNIWVWSTALTFDEGVEDLWANYIVPRRKHLYDTHAAKNAGKTGYPAAGGGYATGSSALIPETQAATETFGKRGALYFTDLNGNKPGEDGFDISNKILGIVNTNEVAIDMSDWTVDGAVVATLKPGTVIPTNSVLWIVDDRRAASDKVVAKGLTKPIVVNLDKTLVDDDGNPIEVFTDATDQLFLKDADGTPAITHEATIGTKYYITLLDAFNCAAAGDIVALLTDINNQTPAAVKTSVILYGDTNTLTGAGFDVADGATLTIASGQIANGALGASPTRIVLMGGKYTNQDYSGIVSNQYHMAQLGLAEGDYTYQVVPGEPSAVTEDEIVLPVAQVEETTSTTNDTGVLAFSKAWLKEKGLATDEQLATTEGKKTVVNNLNARQTNKIQVWENKVLGLDGSKAENIPVILPKQTEDATKVTFKMADQEKVSTDSGAIVTYKVWMGSSPKGKDKGSSEAVLYTQDTAMPLPKDGVQYYMLEVITTPAK